MPQSSYGTSSGLSLLIKNHKDSCSGTIVAHSYAKTKSMILFKLFFGIALIFLIFILFIGFSIIRGFLQLLLGRKTFASYNPTNEESASGSGRYQTEERNRTSPQKKTDKKKVFDDDEGEYVDFEEIKDEK